MLTAIVLVDVIRKYCPNTCTNSPSLYTKWRCMYRLTLYVQIGVQYTNICTAENASSTTYTNWSNGYRKCPNIYTNSQKLWAYICTNSPNRYTNSPNRRNMCMYKHSWRRFEHHIHTHVHLIYTQTHHIPTTSPMLTQIDLKSTTYTHKYLHKGRCIEHHTSMPHIHRNSHHIYPNSPNVNTNWPNEHHI